jgi:hypothetical protein
MIQDVQSTTDSLVVCSVTGFIYATFMLYFMSHFAETVAWWSIFFMQFSLIGGSVICFWKRNTVIDLTKVDGGMGNNNHVNLFEMMHSIEGIFMFMGVVLAILAFIFLVLMFFYFKHIKTAINMLDAAAEFMIGNKRVILAPFTYFFITVGGFFFYLYCLAQIISLNKIVEAQGVAGAGYAPQAKTIDWNITTQFMCVFLTVANIWVIIWLQFSCQYLI